MINTDKKQREEGVSFSPQFGKDGLIPCIVTDAESGEVLMFAYMNREALEKTIETGEAWYWSRSRSELWRKGATSGMVQKVIEMKVDCDQDCLWIRVEIGKDGAACHTGYKSCFYRSVPLGAANARDIKLYFNKSKKAFDPKEIYKDQ